MKKLAAEDRQRIQLAWRTMATDMALSYEDTVHPSLTGQWEGHAVALKVRGESQGKRLQVVTKFEFGNRYLFNTSFRFTRQGFLQDLKGAVGSKDVQVGSAAFDDAVLVKGWNEEAVQALLGNEGVRNACQALLTSPRYTDVEITNRKISGSVKGMVVKPAEVRRILNDCLHVVRLLEEEGARIDGDIGAVTPREKENRELPVSLTSEEGGASGKIGETDEETTDELALEAEPARGTPGTGIDRLSLAALIGALFRERAGGPESEELFRERFQGRKVAGRCKLSYIIPCCDDPVFGKDSGWLAAFDPGEVAEGGNPLVTLQIRYRIGRIRKEDFDRQPGSEMVIEGKLVDYDPGSLILYIDSGDAKEKANSHSATVIVSM